jgi:galactokinase
MPHTLIPSNSSAYSGKLPSPIRVFSPGRVNLIGEHTDYNGGLVLPCAIDHGLEMLVQLKPGQGKGVLLVQTSEPIKSARVSGLLLKETVAECAENPLTSEPVALPESFKETSTSYLFGALVLFLAQKKFLKQEVAQALMQEQLCLELRILSHLPVGGGLSSSAALTTGFLHALSFLFEGQMAPEEMAITAMHVEHRFAGTRCGLMDQLAVTFGEKDNWLAIDFGDFQKSKEFSLKIVKSHKSLQAYTPLVFHTGVAHALATSAYNTRRQQCERALTLANDITGAGHKSLGDYAQFDDLQKLLAIPAWPEELQAEKELSTQGVGFVRELLTAQFEKHSTVLQDSEFAASVLAKRATHAILENFRVRAAQTALEAGDVLSLHTLLTSTHQSLKDDYEVSCSELNAACHILQESCNQLAHHLRDGLIPVIGPRMMGGGFGGSVVCLVPKLFVPYLLTLFQSKNNPYTQATSKEPHLIACPPAEGIHLRLVSSRFPFPSAEG